MLIMETPVSDTAGRLSPVSAARENETKVIPSVQALLEQHFSPETGRYDSRGLADSLLVILQDDPQTGENLKNDVAEMLEKAGNPLDAFHFSKDWEAVITTQAESQGISDRVADALFGHTLRVIEEKPEFSMTSTVTGFLENFLGNTATDLLKLSAILDDISPVGRLRNAALSSVTGEEMSSFDLVEDLGFEADPGQEYGYATSEVVDALGLVKGGVKLLAKGASTAVKAAGDLSDAIIKSPHQTADRVLDAAESSLGSARTGHDADLNVAIPTRAEATNPDLTSLESVASENINMRSADDLMGVEPASPELISAVSKKRDVVIALPGSEELRMLDYFGAEASVGGAKNTHILLRENPSKAALLEEFLHGTQSKLGITDRLGTSGLGSAETHVKDFIIRHQKMLGLGDEDIQILQILRDKGL